MNPGFSSTEGIHIYTGRFSQVTYDAESGTAVIGTGLVWDSVYQQLQDYNVMVLGGRVTGVSGERRDSLGRSILNSIVKGWRGWLPTRRRLVFGGFPSL